MLIYKIVIKTGNFGSVFILAQERLRFLKKGGIIVW